MFERRKLRAVVFISAAFFTMAAIGATSFAQKASGPMHMPEKYSLGYEDVKQLLLLIDTDRTGKISKKEWMTFMEEEFDRLDKNKTGELDTRELAQSRLRVSPFAQVK